MKTNVTKETKSNKEVKEMEKVENIHNQEEIQEDLFKEIEVFQELENIVISEEEVNTLLNEIFTQEVKLDNLKSGFYVYCINIFKSAINKDNVLKALLEMTLKNAKDNNVTKNHLAKAKTIINVSFISVKLDLYLFEGKSNNIKPYYYNIEKMVKLFDYLSENYTIEESKEIRKDLNKLVTKISDKKEYNNTLAKALTDLYKKYKIALTDGGKVIKVELNEKGINSFLSELNEEMLKLVIEKVSELQKALNKKQ